MNASSKVPFIRPEYMPLSIVRAIWKGKFIAVAIFVLGSIGTVFYVSRLPASYYAEALILVDAQKIPSQYVSSVVSTTLQDRLATINRQILSSSRLAKVLEAMKIYSGNGPVPEGLLAMVRSGIAVNVERGWSGDQPGAIRVGYDGPDAKMAAEMANRIANLYVEENLKTRENQAENTDGIHRVAVGRSQEKTGVAGVGDQPLQSPAQWTASTAGECAHRHNVQAEYGIAGQQ